MDETAIWAGVLYGGEPPPTSLPEVGVQGPDKLQTRLRSTKKVVHATWNEVRGNVATPPGLFGTGSVLPGWVQRVDNSLARRWMASHLAGLGAALSSFAEIDEDPSVLAAATNIDLIASVLTMLHEDQIEAAERACMIVRHHSKDTTSKPMPSTLTDLFNPLMVLPRAAEQAWMKARREVRERSELELGLALQLIQVLVPLVDRILHNDLKELAQEGIEDVIGLIDPSLPRIR